MDWLFKLFIKDFENVKEPKVRDSYGKLSGIVGIVSNLMLSFLKYIIGTISGSIAITADGVNNLADASSSVITLVGFKLSALPEDSEHPYGHARIEYIAGMIVSMVIILVGFELGKESIFKILNPEPIGFSYWLIIALVISIIIKIWQSLFNVAAGKRINSLTLIATGKDSRNDVIATGAVLLSLIVGKVFNIYIDGYMGVVVSLFIIYSGVSLTKETISPLLGEAPSQELMKDIQDIIESFDGIIGYHDLVVHNYGVGKTFVSFHIEVDSKTDIMESHEIIDNIEWKLHKELKIFATGHMDPVDMTNPIREPIYQILKEKIKEIDGIIEFHDLRIVSGKDHTNIIFDVLLSPTANPSQEKITRLLSDAIREFDPKCFCVINYDIAYSTI